jgi:hypothetical protein
MDRLKTTIMKKYIYLFLVIMVSSFLVACDQQAPMDTDLYPQSVYIVGAHSRIIYDNLDLSYSQDTINLSVAVSGNRTLDRDVNVTLAECPEAIDMYNAREVSALARQYRNLSKGIYSVPSYDVTVHKGEVYHTLPIYVNPSTLHCDSLYMLAFKISNTSAYKPSKEDTVVLVNLSLSNKYSGQYYMNGVIKNVDNPDDSIVYVMPRTLAATDDGRTVRMYHYNNEWVEGSSNDYRPTYTFKITVNDDNSLKLVTWDKFDLVDGGGTYYPKMKVYDIWYIYRDNGHLWRTEGFIYKERKNNTEQHAINDWMEEMRALKRHKG